MLWFVMMLMPAGPSAMKVMVLADVADAEHKDKMIIAKFLAVSTRHQGNPRMNWTNCCKDHLRSLAAHDTSCHWWLAGVQRCYVGCLH